MSKLLRLVLVNLLSLFDYNGILKEVEAGIKGKSEIRLILIVIASIVYGYLLYWGFNILGESISNKSLILFCGFVIAILISFFVSALQIGPIIFKSEDNEYLFSLPLSKHQIILSKVFNIYLRNLYFVFIILLSNILVLNSFVNVSQSMVLIYLINGIFIPFIPIVIMILLYYFNYYIKFKFGNFVNKVLKYILILLLSVLLIMYFGGIEGNSLNIIFESIFERVIVIYPLTLLFVKSVMELNIVAFVIYIIINLFFVYVFMLFLLKNYIVICSLLKGIKNNSKFVYEKNFCLGNKFGNLRKEFLLIIKNKLYFNSSYSLVIIVSLLIIVLSLFVSIKDFVKINLFYEYYNLYVPFFLAGIISLGNSCINCISLEKDNKEILATMPVKMTTILFNKWLVNVLICGIFIMLDVSIVNILFKPEFFVVIISYVVPLLVVMFISLLSLLLDYRFVELKVNDDGVILKQRIISIIPTLISLLMLVLPSLFKAYILYKEILLSFSVLCIISMVLCILYLIINHSKLRENLMK